MEYQVFVPVPADDLRAVLRDPARLARCVPGLQQDADAGSGPLSGRLKVRVGGHTVTYRGSLAFTERGPDHFTVDGEGTEIRGSGRIGISLALRLTPVEAGTRLGFTADATAGGRTAAFPPEDTAVAVRRLLDRAAGQLTALAATSAPAPAPEEEFADPVAEAEEAAARDAADDGAEITEVTGTEITEATASVFDTEVPPSSLDPSQDPLLDSDLGDLGELSELSELGGTPRPPAEAAHARRTMIGRSAEEVDHAPPRGRYAPVPVPSSATAAGSLRWIAPAAALALASAVVVGRALRRRR